MISNIKSMSKAVQSLPTVQSLPGQLVNNYKKCLMEWTSLYLAKMLPHIRFFSCIVGAFINIEFHMFMTPRPKTTRYTLHGSQLPSHRANRVDKCLCHSRTDWVAATSFACEI
uniref:SFRICE_030508 n=1 Tax=Spodoptera frugiperda TaxID=7108 RepID=A0A2H1W179_SPOFR